jgi:hypothetical protein
LALPRRTRWSRRRLHEEVRQMVIVKVEQVIPVCQTTKIG